MKIITTALLLFSSAALAQNEILSPSNLPVVQNSIVTTIQAQASQPKFEIVQPTAVPPITVPPAAGALTTSDWIKIGGTFGPGKAWQFGFDKSPTVGACIFMGVAKNESPKYILGPCRDFVLLTKNKVPIYHIGVEALAYDVLDLSHSHPYYLGRFGVTVGPAASAALSQLSSRVPWLESMTNWQAPKPLQYIGDITTVDGGGGPGYGVKPVWGAAIKVNVPLPDLWTLVDGAGAK